MCVCGQPVSHDPRQSEFAVECHYCTLWFHGRCVNVNEVDAMEIVKFACPSCTKQGNNTLKYQDTAPMVDMDDLTYAPLPVQRHRLDSSFPSFSHTQSHSVSHTQSHGLAAQYAFSSYYKKNTEPFRRTLRAAVFARSGVRMVVSQEFGSSYFKFHAFDEPLLVMDSNWAVAGLVRSLPVIGLQDISALLSNTASTVRGLEVGSQESFKLSPSGWQSRLSHPTPDAPITAQFRVLETAFRQEVAPPLAVSEIDWHYLLPSTGGSSNQDANPECYGTLCGSGAFFDFSVAPDCKATWLAVSNGEIDVFLVEPTSVNLEAFKEWKGDTKAPSSTVFLADRIDRCTKCNVKSGATLVIPSGWIYAVFSDLGGSFYTGYFSNTLNLPTHLDVWSHLEGADARFARHWQTSSFAHGWATQHPSPAVAPPPPFNAHLWSLVCHYINEFGHIDALLRITGFEKDAIRRALPLLRQWSASQRSIERLDNVSWLPASLHEGSGLVSQLEQVLLAQPAGDATSSLANKLGGLPSLSPNEASYLYSAAGDDDIWSGGAVSSAFSSGGSSSYHQESVSTTSGGNMWDYSSYHNHHQSPGASGLDSLSISTGAHSGSPTFYHQPPLDNSQFSSSLHAGAYGGAAPGQSFGGYMDPTASPNGSHLGMGHGMLDVSSSFGQDMHMRHRASCHRCGNLRKKNVRCPKCPHIFCQKCGEKMVEEHGETVFVDGCPVCKELCCCGKNRTMMCTRKFHCYKKCPATKRQPS